VPLSLSGVEDEPTSVGRGGEAACILHSRLAQRERSRQASVSGVGHLLVSPRKKCFGGWKGVGDGFGVRS